MHQAVESSIYVWMPGLVQASSRGGQCMSASHLSAVACQAKAKKKKKKKLAKRLRKTLLKKDTVFGQKTLKNGNAVGTKLYQNIPKTVSTEYA